MIDSVFIKDILELAFDDFSGSDLLRQQIPYLFETSRQHTGVGVFIHFASDIEIDNYRIDTKKVTNFDHLGNPFEILNGVEIRNESLSLLADAEVLLRNGIIDQIEIWNKSGHDYPLNDPEHYEIHQMWRDVSKRRTIIK